jgi:hypothetical protein
VRFAAFFVAIEDIVIGLAGDLELSTQFGHRSRQLPGELQTALFRPSLDTSTATTTGFFEQ